MVRLGQQQAEQALRRPHTRIFDLSGRAMKNWVAVQPEGLASQADLAGWVEMGWDYAATFPAK